MMTKLEFIKGDITKVKVDAIVNAANKTLLGGGGVDGAIHRAAGPKLLIECKTLGGAETGEAKITKGYDLPSKYVIHTVGPIWHGGQGDEDGFLRACYQNSLELAANFDKPGTIRTIAFPSISTGAYSFPVERAAGIALKTVKEFIGENPNVFEKIIFVLFSDADYGTYCAANKGAMHK